MVSKARNPELSSKLHKLIWDLWVYKSMGAIQIANYINGDTALRAEYGEISSEGVYYHITQIRSQIETTVNEDALDSYVGEFIRAKEGLDNDIQSVQELIDAEMKLDSPNKDMIMKLMKLRHEIKVDRFRLLQDVELPIRVKKLKRERERMAVNIPTPLNVKVEEEIEDGSSEQGNSQVNN